MDIENIKNQILNDDKIAYIIQYMLSKTILENPIKTTTIKYKKHKLKYNKNGTLAIHRMDGTKLFSNIKYQDVAQYCVDNIKNKSKCMLILMQEEELLRFKDKIEFEIKQYQRIKSPHLLDVIEYNISRYNFIKRNMLDQLKSHTQYLK